MTERVDIANMALTSIGEDPITGFEDETEAALIVKTHYGPCRDAVLAEGEWSFAMEQFVPAQSDSVTPRYDFDHAYRIPADCLRVVEVIPQYSPSGPDVLYQSLEGQRPRRGRHKILGRHIYCNGQPFCTGVFRVEEEGYFSPHFVKALAHYLASEIALPLTESNTKRQQAYALYEVALAKALAVDGKQHSSRRVRTTAIVGAR